MLKNSGSSDEDAWGNVGKCAVGLFFSPSTPKFLDEEDHDIWIGQVHRVSSQLDIMIKKNTPRSRPKGKHMLILHSLGTRLFLMFDLQIGRYGL